MFLYSILTEPSGPTTDLGSVTEPVCKEYDNVIVSTTESQVSQPVEGFQPIPGSMGSRMRKEDGVWGKRVLKVTKGGKLES